jgi:hypothetical protein
MFPLSFTSFSGSKSNFAKAWNPSPNFVDNVSNVITNDPTTFFSLAKNGQALVYVGIATSDGPIIVAKNGQAPIFVGLIAFSGPIALIKNYHAPIFVGLGAPGGPTTLAKDGQTLIFVYCSTSNGYIVVVENGPTLVMGSLASSTNSASHGRNHQVHDPNVISSDNVVEIFDFQSNGPPFVPPCKKQKNKGNSQKKLMMTLVNSKLNGQFACHGQRAWCLRGGFLMW